MRYTKLGNSALTVSRICLGCMGFGDAGNGQHSWTVDEEHTRAIIRRALELGVNFFDTAIAYQSVAGEQYVGRALRDFARREDVVVATKFLPRTEDEIAAGVSGQRHIERMLNVSLNNLGLDYVDLYIYHMWDYQTPLYEIIRRVAELADRRGVTMTEIALAWLLTKVTAPVAGAGLYEIKPQTPYTRADLDWMNKKSRSSVEMNDKSFRPPLADRDARVEDYDTIFLGFPIWWYVAPTIINTFLESYDFSGKTIVLFATSSGSGFGGTAAGLKKSAPGAVIREGKLLNGRPSRESLAAWAGSLSV